MSYHVEISEQAEADLRDIYEYIAFTLLAPENASGQLERLEKMIMGLDKMPERFKKYEKEPWDSRGLRSVSVDNFSIFYIPSEEDRVVTIIRVIYSGRDIEQELQEHTSIGNLNGK
ncbi:MAG: type II toxin-antitoxin system RelE/ParE family toxin [Lachnospiraceae bacterium]|nr:type II toxin-antitoxin system RelE/ParE family toxin [Lachnospiraceae bacterium]